MSIALLRAANAAARTLVVDGEGCGDYTTLEEAFDAVGDGDTIWVRPGIYYPAHYIGTNSADVTLQGAGREVSIIDASLITDTMLVAAQNFTLRDLTLRQSEGTGSLFWASDSGGFDFTITADNIVVEQLNASEDNEIWGFGVGYGTTTRVTNSVFRGVHYALAAYHGVNSLSVENSMFLDDFLAVAGIYSGQGFCADSFSVTHSVFAAVGYAVSITNDNSGDCPRPELAVNDNVLIAADAPWAFNVGIPGEITNNLLAPDAIDLGEFYWGDINVHDNLVADPMFVAWSDDGDWTNDDFHLQPGSPAIDAGLDSYATLASDFDGRARPLDGDGDGVAGLDIGPYEYDPSGTTVPVDEIPDTGDCVHDTGGDTADSAEDTGETGTAPDSGDTGDSSGPGDTPGKVDTGDPASGACGCTSTRAPPWLASLLVFALALRRSPKRDG